MEVNWLSKPFVEMEPNDQNQETLVIAKRLELSRDDMFPCRVHSYADDYLKMYCLRPTEPVDMISSGLLGVELLR
jgi:hypothetical protein